MVNISDIHNEDIPDVIQLLRETWIDTYSSCLTEDTVKNVSSIWHNPNILNKQIENPNVKFLVAKKNNQIVGLSTVIRVNRENIVIGRLYVHPTNQKQGIGGLLYEQSISTFGEIKKVHIEIEENNAKGVLFLVKRGFSKVAMKEEDIEGTILKVIVMEKEL